MPWIIAEVNGQQELVYCPFAPDPPRGPGYQHLPIGNVDDNVLIDPPANLNRWLQTRDEVKGFADHLPADDARQQSDDEPSGLPSGSGPEGRPSSEIDRAMRRDPTGRWLDEGTEFPQDGLV